MADTDRNMASLADENAAVGAAKAAARPHLKTGSSNPNMNGPLYLQTAGSNAILVRRKKRKDESTWKQLTRWAIENQIGLAFNLIALIFLAHMFIPKARVHTQKFFYLTYLNPNSGEYGHGADDCYFIFFCIVLFTGLRAWSMEYMLAPLGKYMGISKRKDLTRFSEQGWMLMYYIVFWNLGVYLYVTSPYFMNLKNLWTDWPNRELPGLTKLYLLAQLAFWFQQIMVINIEERRKDHWQMFSHHIITCSLIIGCYAYHQTRVGILILVLMDVVDLFLPLAKCLKYCGYTTICDVLFGIFMLSWFIARHIFYMMVCWSIYAHTPYILTTGCFKGTNDDLIGPVKAPEGLYYLIEPLFNSKGHVCYDENVKWAFLTPLLLLQAITIVWFTMVIRVAMKVLRGDGAEDTRSDDEAVEEEEEEELEDDAYFYEEAQPLEEEVGAESLDLKNWERRTGIKRQASASGVSLPGHSDRKELLGRIGCEKQVE